MTAAVIGLSYGIAEHRRALRSLECSNTPCPMPPLSYRGASTSRDEIAVHVAATLESPEARRTRVVDHLVAMLGDRVDDGHWRMQASRSETKR